MKIRARIIDGTHLELEKNVGGNPGDQIELEMNSAVSQPEGGEACVLNILKDLYFPEDEGLYEDFL